MTKIIVFGNQKICIDCLEILKSKKDIQILCIVGSELSRDKDFGYPSVSEYCRKANLKFINPEILDNNFWSVIKDLKPDICFSIYYRKFIRKDFLKIPPLGFINFHPSLLPYYRGPTPTMWAMVKGEQYVGMTLHYIDDGIDTGDIISQVKVKIPKNITGFGLNTLVMEKGIELFKRQLPLILKKRNNRIKQDHSKASYFGLFQPSVRNIDWFDSKFLIYNKIRALTHPYDGALAYLYGNKVTIWSSKIITKPLKIAGGPGKIVEIGKDGFLVTTIDGFLKITGYQFDKLVKSSENIAIGNKFDI